MYRKALCTIAITTLLPHYALATNDKLVEGNAMTISGDSYTANINTVSNKCFAHYQKRPTQN
ncbi:hypothetical protein BIY21_09225 [Vibrio ponticus]|uniref:Uncharacterized protein n=1 Tax=Vibrio ponticus TaxID=265668 RepID=A0ABX3FJ06_9VIBR|nr:hypothetical protein BIY21_09225 [Vibrio ponticus]